MEEWKRTFTPAKENDNGFYREVSEDGLEIYVYPVMYGYRVRVGKIDANWCNIDYCAGADLTFLGVLYALVKGALRNGFDTNQFPRQDVKPYYNDPTNFAKLVSMAGNAVEPKHFQAGDLMEKRMAFIQRHTQ